METSATPFSGTDRALLAAASYDAAAARAARRRARQEASAGSRRASRREAVRNRASEIAAMPYGIEKFEAQQAFRARADAARRAAETARQEKQMVKDRLRYGYMLTRETMIGDIVVEPFTEEGLRSHAWGLAAKLFLRGLPRKGKLRSSRDKAIMGVRYRSKLLSCDEPWIEGNRTMVSLIRVDLDASFESMDALRAELGDLVASGVLPCMPHLIAGGDEQVALDWSDVETVIIKGERKTRLTRPHLWFILPDAVGTGSSHRRRPQALVDAVYRGLVDALRGMGADPKAKWQIVRGKNPLSPIWSGACFNQDTFPSLSEYAAVLGERMSKSVEDLTRDAAADAAGSRTFSNVFFDAACRGAWSILKAWHADGYGPYLKALEQGPDDLKALLRSHLTVAAVTEAHADVHVPERAERVLDLTAGYAASAWSPERADEIAARARRGRLSHLTEGVEALSERQAIAARVTTEVRVERTRTRIMKAMAAIEASGAPFTQAEIARVSGLNRKTVALHFRFCVTRRPVRCLDKKVSSLMASSSMPRAVPSVARMALRAPKGSLSVVTRPAEVTSTRAEPVESKPEVVEAAAVETMDTTITATGTAQMSTGTPRDQQKPRQGAAEAPRAYRPPVLAFMRGGVPADPQKRAVLEARIKDRIAAMDDVAQTKKAGQ